MKRYKTRMGIILTEIADENVLVAAKALQEEFPYVTQINESSAFLWKKMENGASISEMADAAMKEYEIEDRNEVYEAIVGFVRQMEEMKYLVVVEGE